MRQVSLFLVALAAVSVFSCSRPPGSGSIDGLDLGLKTELHLKDLARSEAPAASVLGRVKTLFENPPRQLDSLRSYTAVTETEEDGTIAVDIRVLPLSEEEGPGWLAVVLDPDGRVMRARIWGNEEFDEDPEAAWENYWRQFEYERSRGVIRGEEAPTSHDARALWDSLQVDTSADASLTRLMYEHRQMMYDNSFLVRRSMAISEGERVPPSDWIDKNRRMYDRLLEMADELTPVIGDSAASRYAGVVEEGGQILALIADEVAASNGDGVVERIQTFRRRTCGACHGIENHTAGEGMLKDALMGRLDEFGVRRDLYVADFDVWSVPQNVERSQAVANAIKAVLVVAGTE